MKLDLHVMRFLSSCTVVFVDTVHYWSILQYACGMCGFGKFASCFVLFVEMLITFLVTQAVQPFHLLVAQCSSMVDGIRLSKGLT